MKYFIFNLVDGDRERVASFLNAKRWVVGREERHRDALASGDLVLVFVAVTSEFVGRAKLETAFLDPIPGDAAASGPAVSGVLLADADAWTSGVPLAVAVQRIDPMGSNPYVQANAAGFRSGVVQITAEEYDKVLSLHDEARPRGIRAIWGGDRDVGAVVGSKSPNKGALSPVSARCCRSRWTAGQAGCQGAGPAEDETAARRGGVGLARVPEALFML